MTVSFDTTASSSLKMQIEIFQLFKTFFNRFFVEQINVRSLNLKLEIKTDFFTIKFLPHFHYEKY